MQEKIKIILILIEKKFISPFYPMLQYNNITLYNKSFGLKIDAIKNNSLFGGGIIMWCSSEKYPSFVFRSQEDIIKKCGIKVDY